MESDNCIQKTRTFSYGLRQHICICFSYTHYALICRICRFNLRHGLIVENKSILLSVTVGQVEQGSEGGDKRAGARISKEGGTQA